MNENFNFKNNLFLQLTIILFALITTSYCGSLNRFSRLGCIGCGIPSFRRFDREIDDDGYDNSQDFGDFDPIDYEYK